MNLGAGTNKEIKLDVGFGEIKHFENNSKIHFGMYFLKFTSVTSAMAWCLWCSRATRRIRAKCFKDSSMHPG